MNLSRAVELESATLQPLLPDATQTCPKITEGTISFLGINVDIIVAGSHQKSGPLILYWHGTGTQASHELETAFNMSAQQKLRQAGGLFAAFVSTSGKGRNTSGNGIWTEYDMTIADEVIACAVKQMNIDPQRIHVLGMSAGGLHSAAMSYQRSHYLASMVSLSGGHLILHGQNATNIQASEPANKLSALIIHGGSSDEYILNFKTTSTAFAETLRARGHDAYLCDHGQGHSIPDSVSQAVWRFFNDHPFGKKSQYTTSLPKELKDLCRG